MRFYRLLHLTIVLLCLPLCGLAQSDGIFKSVTWTPTQLTSGSPCLLTVDFETSPAGLQGDWFGHKVDFFPSSDKTVWHALAGADVEITAGNYTLTLHATMPDGKSVSTTRVIPIGPSSYKQVELHVAENFVAPDAATLKRIAADKLIRDPPAFQWQAGQYSSRYGLPCSHWNPGARGQLRESNSRPQSLLRGELRGHRPWPTVHDRLHALVENSSRRRPGSPDASITRPERSHRPRHRSAPAFRRAMARRIS